MALLSFGSALDLVPVSGEESQVEVLGDLPGLTLSHFTVTDLHEPFWQSKAEVYLIGVAVDASNEVRVIPFGHAELGKEEDFVLTRGVSADQKVQFMGNGMLLVTPPLKGFLAIRLLLVDSDAKARDIAPIIKSVAEVTGNDKVIAALVATGMPHAAAVAFVATKAIEAASLALEKNNDDIISLFEGYFTPTDMIAGEEFDVTDQGASARFAWVAA